MSEDILASAKRVVWTFVGGLLLWYAGLLALTLVRYVVVRLGARVPPQLEPLAFGLTVACLPVGNFLIGWWIGRRLGRRGIVIALGVGAFLWLFGAPKGGRELAAVELAFVFGSLSALGAYLAVWQARRATRDTAPERNELAVLRCDNRDERGASVVSEEIMGSAWRVAVAFLGGIGLWFVGAVALVGLRFAVMKLGDRPPEPLAGLVFVVFAAYIPLANLIIGWWLGRRLRRRGIVVAVALGAFVCVYGAAHYPDDLGKAMWAFAFVPLAALGAHLGAWEERSREEREEAGEGSGLGK